MISYHSNYFQVVINMSQVPIKLYPPPPPPSEKGGEIAQLITKPFTLFKVEHSKHPWPRI